MAKHKEPRADHDWWTLWPTVLNDELAAFARLGITPRTIHKRNGVLILEADWPVQGLSASMLLRIGYSPLHPFFRPAVAAPNANFDRHQNPLTRELCLLTQEAGQWNSNQLVADFIQERLDQLLRTLAARNEGRWDDAAKLEEQVPDPLMPYFTGLAEDDSVILFDGQATLPAARHGLMEVVYTGRETWRSPAAFEGVVRQLKDSQGASIGKRFGFPNEPKDAQVITGRWVKFTPPPITDVGELLRLAEEELGRHAVLQPGSVQKLNETKQGPFSITGIAFPDEAEYGSQKNGAGWLFLVTRRGPTGDAETRLILGERAGKDDVFSRLPVARSLLTKKVLVVGCGAIGGFAGLELARAGVGEIEILDFDTVQPGNSLRWPLGRSAWGSAKSIALANFIAANYPWTKAIAVGTKIGAAETDPDRLPGDQKGHVLAPIFDLLRAAHVVVDASASPEVHLALSHYCRRFRVPYVIGYATLGLAGGIVARHVPDSEGCFVCLQEHLKDNQEIPRPRVDDAGIVIPVGCNAPTFTGGGFDLQEISLEIVRTAVGLLSDGTYDPGGWEVAVLTLKGDGGVRMLPHWEGYQCPAHPRCCGATL
ncbi:ThiF family adenylyltransferase [Bradyrhizobium sp. 190]|uniref:ThiF family adenylyltransferase n=1 Tax=Bradyrhizobium sp. 190 TaxID=2782658 RepID=UPI001FFBA97E|nr:ThiF family adenylyltransferase [Bradyrhizobium sp. 190]MCK1515088.1 ThiF family adenylyltransferase [Bradyrhizobium sp. 190]